MYSNDNILKGVNILKHIQIENLSQGIIALCSPSRIFLYSAKQNIKGELSSFKLCLVVDDSFDKIKLETSIYLNLECDIPFDILIYHETEFDELCEETGSFANRIWEGGELLYGQIP